VSSFFFLTMTLLFFTVGGGPLTKIFSTKVENTLPPELSKLVFFVIDVSGSMAEPMPNNESVTKMNVVQKALLNCVNDLDSADGGSDLISLISFARAARINIPFSRDRSFLHSAIQALKPITISQLNGTAIGYAVFKGVSLILACKSFARQESSRSPFIAQSMIVITDGLEEPHPGDRNHPFRSMRLLPALENAREEGVCVYYVNVDKNSYKMMSLGERDKITKAVDATGGKYYEITSGESLEQVLKEIVRKESKEKVEVTVVDNSMIIGLWLIVLTLITLSLSRMVETVLMRETR
jgi:Ca-activated chloride channel homolog